MNCNGQYSIIAALLVAVILIATVIITYSTIRTSPIQVQPQILSTIDETNMALKEILGFTVGYYGSVLQVTGNTSYATELAINFTRSGLENIARMHPELGASFNLSSVDLSVYWYTNRSWSRGRLAVNYSLANLGLYGMTYETSCELKVQVKETTPNNQTMLIITKDEDEPLINLGKQNFKFYRYVYENSTWKLINPSIEPVVDANGTYTIDIPYGVDPSSYIIQVEDQRGLIVVTSSFSRYTCTLNWNNTLYSTLKNATDATIVVELLQNGTMRWLGQNILNLTTQSKPIPPIPVKAFRVNQTINDVNQEVPFQIEEWASDYKVPLSLASNASVFSNRNMLVFLVNPNVSKVTIWWNGSDTVNQTSLAYTNKHFSYTFGDEYHPITINNGILKLAIDFSGSENSFKAISTLGTSTNTAVLMRINQDTAHYGHSRPMYAITNGTVRVVVQHEVEWPGGGVDDDLCPNVYAHIVLTLPANATYYTYQLRLIFINSTRTRNITDICPIKITNSSATSALTENGTRADGYPNVSTASSLFYNMSNIWQHHWAQLNSGATRGFGIMFTDAANKMLYCFDAIAGKTTGALNVTTTLGTVELLPVAKNLNASVSFTYPLDVIWYGAVATFDGTTPVYNSSNQSGLWVLVEYPPVITVTTET
jgi:hypothetical protein